MSHGTRVIHDGSHGPQCFACKLPTLNFGKVNTPASAVKDGDRWKADPVKERIEEIHGIEIDTDAMNKRRVDQLGS